ncbi:hypothetical protein [Desnuesiella massiliensis]|uniref:hypothetical protein n=1 Tax=Desnuesiella massiliensis TaxID=1650662 RepID=UPI0006E31D4E|nr:hypothetical protein [Desnuesiella massiliensis]
MKKVKRSLLLILMSLLLIPTVLIGCSSKPKIGPDETAQILFDFYIKGDQSGLSKISINKDMADETKKIQKDATIKKIKDQFKAGGLTIKDDQVEELYKVRSEALKGLSATAEVVSKTDTTAEVKLKSKYIDEVALDEKAADDAVKQVEKLQLKDEKDALNKLTEQYIKNLVEAYKNVKPAEGTKEKTFKFKVQEKIWLAEDMKEFGAGIAAIAIGL